MNGVTCMPTGQRDGSVPVTGYCRCVEARSAVYDNRRAKRLGFRMDDGHDMAVVTHPD